MIKSLVHKLRLHGRRGKRMPESFSREKLRHASQKEGRWMKNPVCPSPCVTPAGTSNELDVQNEREEKTTTQCIPTFTYYYTASHHIKWPAWSSLSVLCVCVLSSHLFWTSDLVDAPAGVTQEEGHTGFLHLPSAVLALIFIARRIWPPFLSLVDHEVKFCVPTHQSFSTC